MWFFETRRHSALSAARRNPQKCHRMRGFPASAVPFPDLQGLHSRKKPPAPWLTDPAAHKHFQHEAFPRCSCPFPTPHARAFRVVHDSPGGGAVYARCRTGS